MKRRGVGNGCVIVEVVDGTVSQQKAAFVEGSAVLRQSPEACQDASITKGRGGGEEREREGEPAPHNLQAASFKKLTLALLAINWQPLSDSITAS